MRAVDTDESQGDAVWGSLAQRTQHFQKGNTAVLSAKPEIG